MVVLPIVKRGTRQRLLGGSALSPVVSSTSGLALWQGRQGATWHSVLVSVRVDRKTGQLVRLGWPGPPGQMWSNPHGMQLLLMLGW